MKHSKRTNTVTARDHNSRSNPLVNISKWLGLSLLVTTHLPIAANIEQQTYSNTEQQLQNYQFTNSHHSVVSEADNPASLFIWQGFDHEWKRHVLFPKEGRTPHRISTFHNYIDNSTDNAPSTTQAVAHMSQSTGVDGDYMRPKVYYSAAKIRNAVLTHGQAQFQWTDGIDADSMTAINQLSETIRIPLPSTQLDQDQSVETVHQGFLQGIALDLNCDNDKQPTSLPCNSNGMWPYEFSIDLEDCSVAASAEFLECPLNVDIHRGWTPNKGGVEFIGETKPLNAFLDYELTVHYSIISAPEQSLLPSTRQALSEDKTIYDYAKNPSFVETQPTSPDFSNFTTVLTSFAFSLSEPDELALLWKFWGSNLDHRGRYIDKLSFFVEDDLQSQSTATTLDLWSPKTVVNSNLNLTIESQRLLFSSAEIQSTQSAESLLCINSSDQAPFFSVWKMCDYTSRHALKKYGGVNRDANSIDLTATW